MAEEPLPALWGDFKSCRRSKSWAQSRQRRIGVGGGAAEESRKEKEWHQLKHTEMGPYDRPFEDDA
jgi:hypothetical protein